MALVPTVIETAVNNLIVTKPADAQAACDALASAYQSYAASAQAGVAVPVFTGTERTRFAAALFAVFRNTDGSAAGAAGAFVAAVTTFWLTPPVVFGAGVVTAFAGAPALLASLTALFSSFNDAANASAGVASALDAATRTIAVVIGPTTFTLS